MRQENIGSAWVLFEDKQSVVNAVEFYNNGEVRVDTGREVCLYFMSVFV